MNPIRRWILEKELSAIDEKLLRYNALVDLKVEYEFKLKNANKISSIWYSYVFNKTSLELDTLDDQKIGLEERKHEITHNLKNEIE